MKRCLIIILLLLAFSSCSSSTKIGKLKKDRVGVSLSMSDEYDFKELDMETIHPDTLRIIDPDGKEVLIMKAVKDENGEMVANDVIDAAVVRAKFRNVAERNGNVDLRFQVFVPASLIDGKWQLRFYPKLMSGNDVTPMDKIFITGKFYRKSQLRGYEQYNRFLDSIISDTTLFIRRRPLEIFLQRNIPQIYALRNDSTYVSDERFSSIYGVTQQVAVAHYTDRFARNINRRKIARKDAVFGRLVKVPIMTDSIRLDTVFSSGNDFVYEYCQSIHPQPSLKKVSVLISGEIYESSKKIMTIPEADPLTFYISSLSSLVDETPRFITKVLKRQVSTNSICWIDFEKGSDKFDMDQSNNRIEAGRISDNLSYLIGNEDFVIDSVTITASCSPEGSFSINEKLSKGRAESVRKHFETGTDFKWKTRFVPENWQMLEILIQKDSTLLSSEKRNISELWKISDLDMREAAISKIRSYRYIREKLYPRLRTVRFDFYLHRRDLVRDTVITDIPDTLYESGVKALKDRDYGKALAILRPYDDYNSALALKAMDYNATALSVLDPLPKTDKVEYLLALVCSRLGDDMAAVQHYINSCHLNGTYVHRGNLDPEISSLITKYNLNFYQSQ